MQSRYKANKAKSTEHVDVHTVIGQDEQLCTRGSETLPIVEDHSWLRGVYDNEVHISDKVAYAHYDKCGHNVFFDFECGFQPPSDCPLEDAGSIDEDSVDLPTC